MQTEKDKSK